MGKRLQIEDAQDKNVQIENSMCRPQLGKRPDKKRMLTCHYMGFQSKYKSNVRIGRSNLNVYMTIYKSVTVQVVNIVSAIRIIVQITNSRLTSQSAYSNLNISSSQFETA